MSPEVSRDGNAYLFEIRPGVAGATVDQNARLVETITTFARSRNPLYAATQAIADAGQTLELLEAAGLHVVDAPRCYVRACHPPRLAVELIENGRVTVKEIAPNLHPTQTQRGIIKCTVHGIVAEVVNRAGATRITHADIVDLSRTPRVD